MTDPNPPTNHLAHIREQLAQLVARLEQVPGPEAKASLAHALTLLQQVTVAEVAVANDDESAEALRQIDGRYRQSLERLAEIRDRLDHTPHPHRPDLHEHPPSSGSTIGDAVRDSFLNMG